ncbi:hypothetical protein CUMW_187700 [Citrus unshiu]|uniref:Uncharacterized protein n=1 Tax=Citrus unshiu TaxID=55188 RepID=A0A2H5Q1M0_CITUN|nr:hypothetical protein CUMW_187700 [Citrus unshiu]
METESKQLSGFVTDAASVPLNSDCVLLFLLIFSMIATAMAAPATSLALHCSIFFFTSFVAIFFIFCASLLLQHSFPES